MYALEILFTLTPWMEENNNLRIIFHYIPDSMGIMFEPHQVIHHLATSSKMSVVK